MTGTFALLPPTVALLLRLLLLAAVVPSASAARFAMHGPALTLTLKDPVAPGTSSPDATSSDGEEVAVSRSSSYADTLGRVFDVSGLAPSVTWGTKSVGPPLPKWLPWLQSLACTAGHTYHDGGGGGRPSSSPPSFVNGDVQLGSFGRRIADVRINPTYLFREKRCDVSVSVGSAPPDAAATTRPNVVASSASGFYALARFTSKGKQLLEFVTATYKQHLPFDTVSSVTLTPSFDFTKSLPSCVLAGESGTGRTTAILDLNVEDPTLAVVHELDSRNTISPEISLHNAKIMYNWDVSLRSGGSVRTRVDPTSAIQVTWTDMSQSGRWVTDFKLPLEGMDGPLAADVRVRRQFIF